jgi:hypothetical protein
MPQSLKNLKSIEIYEEESYNTPDDDDDDDDQLQQLHTFIQNSAASFLSVPWFPLYSAAPHEQF